MNRFILYVFMIGVSIAGDALGKPINSQDYYFINIFNCSFPVPNNFNYIGDIYFNSGYILRFLDVLSGIPPKTCASIAPNTGMRKRRGRQRDTATGIGDS
ncbi:hypothetical protein, partial [Thiolapillus sp.]|uniref:hypothetical protein n=1 Tax=Thiolapillus sp. TaxID=2017437 RepID=UPI003AF60CE5